MPFVKISLYACRKNARAALRRSGMAPVIAAIAFLCFFTVLGLCALFKCCFSAIPALSEALAYALAVLCSVICAVLLVAPFRVGLDAFILEFLRRGRVDHALLLSFYTEGRRYRAAVLSMLARVLRIFAFSLLLWTELLLGVAVTRVLLEGGDSVRATLVLGMTVLFFLLMCLFFAYSSASLFLTDAVLATSPLLTYRQAKALSALKMRHYRSKAIGHTLAFLPLFLLSLLLLGIPFMFLIPYIRASRCEMAALLLKS